MSDENRLILFRGPFGLKCAPHVNSELEIIVVTRGKIDITVGDTVMSAEKGDAVLILPYETHAFSPYGDAEGRVYMFHPSLSDELFNKRSAGELVSGKFSIPPCLSDYLDYATPNAEKSPDAISARSLFFPLIGEYLAGCSVSVCNNPKKVTVRSITEYIHANLTEKITQKSVAASLGINSASLSAILREYTGLSFTEFVNNLRLEKAVSLLGDCDVSITETAYLSGFGSIRNFNRIFYDTLGITPTEYKKQRKYYSSFSQ